MFLPQHGVEYNMRKTAIALKFPGNRLSGQAPSWELVDPLGVRADTTHLVGLGPLLGADSGEMALHRSIGAHIAEFADLAGQPRGTEESGKVVTRSRRKSR